MTQIKMFLDFAVIKDETCLAHWFMITAAALNLLLLLIIVIIGKKQPKLLGVTIIVGLAVFSCVSAIFAHCLICWIALGVNGLILLIDILFFCLWKRKEKPAPVENVCEESVQELSIDPVQESPQEMVVETNSAPLTGLSLVESIESARAVNNSLVVTKTLIASYLYNKYEGIVTLNRKDNYTSTGLPLADAHYVQVSADKKVCFIYVFELKDDKSFMLVRTNKGVFETIKAKHASIYNSTFPHVSGEMVWHSVIFDESYKSVEDVYEVIDLVINSFDKTPAPVKEEPKPVEPEPVIEADESQDGINYLYKFSFSARLIRAGAERQDFYNEIKNEYLSYKKVNSKISWGHELFKLGRIKLGQMKVKGKTLCVYLPLDPKKYDQERLWFKETGNEEFPMMMQVKSDRAVKYVKELIADVMANNEIPHNDNYEAQDYRLPEMSIEEMLAANPPLAKLTDGSAVPVVEKKPEPVVEKVEKIAPSPVVLPEADESGIDYKYKFSFSARLIRAGADRQEFYNTLKNEFLAYKKVASKISWGHELFKLGRIKLGQMKVKGKTLCVYLPLDTKNYDQERFHFKETGDEEFPMMMKVTSDRAVKYVIELLVDVMKNSELAKVEGYVAQDYRLPEMSIEEMLKSDPPLAKENTSTVSFNK